MSPTAIPTRITIDFRDAVHPSRTWILGLGDDAASRVELLAFDTLASPVSSASSAWSTRPAAGSTKDRGAWRSPALAGRGVTPTALSADCVCPEFCERDHANE